MRNAKGKKRASGLATATAKTVSATKALHDAAVCGCEVDDQRKAAGVDSEIKKRNLSRLRRIEGQVRGLQKMVEDERYCADIMVQISSVREALRGVSRELMRNHLRHCVARAIQSGDDSSEAAVQEELLDLFFRKGDA